MRRTSRRFVRVATAAALTMLCATPAPAGKADYLLELGGVEGESSGDKHKNEIEVLSYSWGATRASDGQVDALTDGLLILRNSESPASGAAGGGGGGAGGMGAGKVSMQDMSVMRGPRQTTSADGVKVAAGDVNGDGRADVVAPRDAASGLATGKRMHKPVLSGAAGGVDGPVTFPTPRDKGSLTVRGKFPGCAAGTRYPTLTLGGRGKRFTLQDAIITSCARSSGGDAPMEEVSFNYAKIRT